MKIKEFGSKRALSRETLMILAIAGVICLAFFAVGYFQLKKVQKTEVENARTLLVEASESGRAAINAKLRADFQALNTAALGVASFSVDSDELYDFLHSVTRSNSFAETTYTTSGGVSLKVDANGGVTLIPAGEADEFTALALSGESVAALTGELGEGAQALRCIVPVVKNKAVTGALEGVSAVGGYSEILDAALFDGGGFRSIIDRQGNVVIPAKALDTELAAADIWQLGVFSDDFKSEIAEKLGTGRAFSLEFSDAEGEAVQAVCLPMNYNNWYLLTALREDFATALAEGAKQETLLMIAAALAVFLMLTMLQVFIQRDKREALERSGRMLYTVLENMSSSVKLVDISDDVNVIYSNKLKPLNGSETLSDGIIDPVGKNTLLQATEAVKMGERFESTLEAVDQQGNQRWVNVRATSIGGLRNCGEMTMLVVTMDVTRLKRTEAQLESATDRLQMLIDNVPGGIMVFDFGRDGRIKTSFINDGLYKMFGYTREEYEKTVLEDGYLVLFPEDRAGMRDAINTALRGDGTFQYMYKSVNKRGEVCWLALRAQKIDEHEGTPTFFAMLIDVTEQKQLEQELIMKNERVRILEETTEDTLLDYDTKLDKLTLSQKTKTGIKKRELENYLMEKKYINFVHSDYWKTFEQTLVRAMTVPDRTVCEFVSVDGDRTQRWIKLTAQGIVSEQQGRIVNVLGRMEDITNTVRELNIAREKAAIDIMTGVLNKASLTENIKKYLEKEGGEGCGLLMFDLDNFKSINDKYGHLEGDRALIDAATLLKRAFSNFVVGRFGGDEFAVFMHAADETLIAERAAAFKTLLEERNSRLDTQKNAAVTCSVGAVFVQNGTASVQELIDCADKAMYTVKQKHKNGFYMMTL